MAQRPNDFKSKEAQQLHHRLYPAAAAHVYRYDAAPVQHHERRSKHCVHSSV